jgi:hypothetical protein
MRTFYDDETMAEPLSVFDQRTKDKERKRRWREIDQIRDTRRLKRELTELNVDSRL